MAKIAFLKVDIFIIVVLFAIEYVYTADRVTKRSFYRSP